MTQGFVAVVDTSVRILLGSVQQLLIVVKTNKRPFGGVLLFCFGATRPPAPAPGYSRHLVLVPKYFLANLKKLTLTF